VDDDAAPRPEPSPAGTAAEADERTLVIDDVQGLVRHRKAIANRLQAHPEAARLLIVNPVLAFADAGIKLAPAVANHVLHAIQYPPEVRAERTRLEHELRRMLGRAPRPTHPHWLAETVFDQLGVAPVVIGQATPVYRPAFDAATIARLESLLPTRGVVTVPGPAPTTAGPSPLSFDPRSLGLLDLDAPVPELPPAERAPEELALLDLWFYKDRGPALRPLLELGIVINSGVAIYTSSQYRKIRDGQTQGELASWIRVVNVPSRPK